MKTWCRILVICSLITSFVFPSMPLMACGPYFTSTIFSYSTHPDFPLRDFAGGKLGVIGPGLRSYYLVVAYRYLTGRPLSADEQQAAVAYWHDRIRPSAPKEDPLGDWLRERNSIPWADRIGYISASRSDQSYYFNCSDDAFRTAKKTLSERIGMFGRDTEEVRQWLAAQDAVFRNCPGGQSIPPAAPANMPPVIKADRAYQIAAACFYSGNFDEAEARFRKIAKDKSSPWRKIAPYLAARSILRKSSLEADYGDNDMAELERAEKAFKQIVQDRSLTEFHDSSKRLLNLIEYRRDPSARLKALSAELLHPRPGDDIYHQLKNYIYILNNNFYGNRSTDPDDMTDWIRTVQNGRFDHALEKWGQTRALHWLVAALMTNHQDGIDVPALLEQAKSVKPGSRAYLTAAYYRAAIMSRSGGSEQIHKEINDILSARGKEMSPSTYNLFLSLKETQANDLQEFFTYAKKRPVGVFVDYDDSEIPDDWKPGVPDQFGAQAFFDFGTALTFNQQMPVALLVKAAASDILPDHLRARVALAAWTRAVLLDEDDAAAKLASMLIKLVPELKDDLSAYLAANRAERKFIAQYIILRNPGMSPDVSSGIGRETPIGEIDSFRDNWWCYGKTLRVVGYPAFITASQQKKALDEWMRVTDITTAPDYLAAGVITWAKAHPNDPRVPEALHRAVKATRYGCTDKATGPLSKEAHTLLHKQYPDSPWTKETPYWYN